MTRAQSARTRQAAATVLLAVLSAVPYAMVYGIDRALSAPNAATAALWPTAVVPVLVAGLLAVQLVHARTSKQAKPAAVRTAPLDRSR